MSLIGQPESYSEMLKRIFAATLTMGIGCTFFLGTVSPAVKTFLESWSAETSIGILDGVKALYVVLPLVVAIGARVFLLHDRISDLLGIRRRFDFSNILIPLAEGVGFPTSGPSWNKIENNRDVVMTRTFYRYASFKDPKIDVQLVRTAADRWAWFWCMIEPQFVLLITAIILVFLRSWSYLLIVFLVMVVLSTIGFVLWPQLRNGARNQVREILENAGWKAEILAAFQALSGATKSSSPPLTAAPKSMSTNILDVFISHASEDKDSIARPLYNELTRRGVSVWFDEASLELGDSLRRKIDDGLARCRFGVVILSPRFLAKEWPQRELDGLVARETTSGEKAILPVWHDLDAVTLAKYSPTLADRLAARSSDGVPQVAEKIIRVVKK